MTVNEYVEIGSKPHQTVKGREILFLLLLFFIIFLSQPSCFQKLSKQSLLYTFCVSTIGP